MIRSAAALRAVRFALVLLAFACAGSASADRNTASARNPVAQVLPGAARTVSRPAARQTRRSSGLSSPGPLAAQPRLTARPGHRGATPLFLRHRALLR